MQPIDFRGFSFNGIHSRDLNLEVISTSDRYEARTLPNPTDYTADVPGSDGQYYFGSTYKNREIVCNVAFNNVSEQIYRKIRQLFSTDKLCKLVFDEEPYKTWRAKLKSKPDFKSLCFTDKETGQRVYKGDGKLTFICYFPYAFGYDKYIVKAADYYMLNPPECIINESYSDETFVKKHKKENFGKELPQDTKYHFNLNPCDYKGGPTKDNVKNDFYRDKSHRNKDDRGWIPNGNAPWKTGFPTIEQVQAGELFFDTENGTKTIVDSRAYWKNVPEWQGTAKLLTTPTLDFDHQLIYLPQYSKTSYINMENGFDNGSSMIGSRMLVYNPGDIPVDWEIRFEENKRAFWSCRGGTKFRIKRYNVERLPIEKAVDWCGLKTYEAKDNVPYKYGRKYFKRRGIDLASMLEKLNEYAAASEESWNSTAPLLFTRSLEDIDSSDYTRNIQTLYDIKAKISKGRLPADKWWEEEFIDNKLVVPAYSEDYAWDKLPRWEQNSSDAVSKYYELLRRTDIDGKQVNNDNYGPLRISFNLHLNDNFYDHGNPFREILKNNNFDLGKAHPDFCYYVEPIPREKLSHYIKLFYWQTIQWRGDRLSDNTWINEDKYKEMLPEELFEIQENEAEGTKKYFLKDLESPIAKFLKMFVEFNEDKGIIPWNDKWYREIYKNLDYERGIEFANRYDELRELCVTEEEEFELYWDTLKKLLCEFEPIIYSIEEEEMYHFFNLKERQEQYQNDQDKQTRFKENLLEAKSYSFIHDGRSCQDRVDEFIYNYINYPSEFITSDSRDLDYDNVLFNGYRMPEWITEDYLEIDQKEFSGVAIIKEYLSAIEEDQDAIFIGKRIQYTPENRTKLYKTENHSQLIKKLDNTIGVNGYLNDLLDNYYFVNSENRMLYTTANKYGTEFDYTPNKIVMNEAITQGKWFKLPPGWSLITIEPIISENLYDGDRWKEARLFDWGYGGDAKNHPLEAEQLFNFVESIAREEFLKIHPVSNLIGEIKHDTRNDWITHYQENAIIPLSDIVYEYIIDGANSHIEIKDEGEYFKFKTWYEDKIRYWNNNEHYFAQSLYQRYRLNYEYEFLRIVNEIWNTLSQWYKWTSQKGVFMNPDTIGDDPPTLDDYDVTGKPLRCINGDISDWWWYACNHLWSNFPPPYWGAADLLNKIQIKYTPLYY